jgi:hypothetical protein
MVDENSHNHRYGKRDCKELQSTYAFGGTRNLRVFNPF